MDYSEFKAKTKQWNLLGAVDTLGSFDFFTLIVSFDSLKREDFTGLVESFSTGGREKLTADQYVSLSKILPLAAHEYTHFIDTTSTIWGMRYMNLMNEAYLADARHGGMENDFYKAKDFYDYSRSIRLPKYYTLTDLSNPNIQPWSSTITIGQLFSTEGKISRKRVLFTRFTNANDELLARSPISLVSLLEASATAQEIFLKLTLLSKMDNNFKLVEQTELTKKIMAQLYDPRFTEYSSCVHLIANKQSCPDVIQAFLLCAKLTRIVLNFCQKSYSVVSKNCPVSDIFGVEKGSAFEEAIREALMHMNSGVLYYALCLSLPANSYINEEKSKKGIELALSTIGIDSNTLKRNSDTSAHELTKKIMSSDIASISTISTAGYENFKNIRSNNSSLNFNKLNIPPVLLGDSTENKLFHSPDNLLNDFNLTSCFDEMYIGQSWVERFQEACL